MTDRQDDAMLIARMIVEAHINTWGYIPHPDHLKSSIAANLRKAARLGTVSNWPIESESPGDPNERP